MIEQEIWADVSGYNGKYKVSNFGNVKSFSRWGKGRNLSQHLTSKNRYYFVALVKDSRKSTRCVYVHRLVADAFVDNPYNLSEVNHKDGNTKNNRFDNLEWCTHKQNMEHASISGALSRGQDKYKGKLNANSKPVLQIDMDGNIVHEWESVNEIGRKTGYDLKSIFNCCGHKPYYHTAYGYKWEYKNGAANS